MSARCRSTINHQPSTFIVFPILILALGSFFVFVLEDALLGVGDAGLEFTGLIRADDDDAFFSSMTDQDYYVHCGRNAGSLTSIPELLERIRGERDEARYFAYLNLFLGAMLLLVLADNLLLMFVGWEGVGLCSYLLIGFWYERRPAADAGKKAFIVNRVGRRPTPGRKRSS